MAFKGKVITNKKTGQQIRFIQTSDDTGGELLEMESIFQPHSTEPVPHYHPFQQEYFTVFEGEINVRVNGEVNLLREGDKLYLEQNKIHSMWNDSSRVARVNWKVMPASETEYFLENGVGIANEKRTNEKGMPSLLQVALLARRFSHVYRVARPSYPVQRLLFTALAPFSYLAGYRPCYREFVD